ncbi:MAG: TonB-dependent receptor [Acidobacteria bacterium]|nr:MAG: TonB-dependent receptor [Acidobacteriota bacterium]REJ99518.1 MAG: TonB-dependent receptor [Acidobacteriota bacterium]
MRSLRSAGWLGLLLSFVAAAALADGVITGLVLDGRTGQPVRSATVVVEGTDTTFTTDLNGVFQGAAPAGTQVLLISGEGYKTSKLTGVAVAEGGVANVSAIIEPTDEAAAAAADPAADGSLSEEITVQAEAIAATEQALLAERKASAQIVDNIGSEEMSKNAGSSAAGALERVTGVSVQEGKFVFVRGLGERYSNTQLNGSKMPSTEFERKVVPLDLFSSGLLEKITVSKSYTVDQPGDFAAGVVSLETKQFPPQQRLSLGVSVSDNSVASGENILGYPGGLDFSGDGGQNLPAGFPSQRIVRFSPFTGVGLTDAELETLGEQLVGAWTPTRGKADQDTGFNITYGNSFDRLGVVLSGSWSDSFDARTEQRNYYTFSLGEPEVESFYDIDYGTETVRRSLMGNFAYRIGNNTQVRLRGLLTDTGEGEGRFQEGFFANLGNDIENFRIQYRSQAVDNYQLSGDHFLPELGAGGSLIEWRAALSEAETHEDLREALYTEEPEGFTLEPIGQSGFLYYNDLVDELDDYRLDWSTFLTRGEAFGSIKLGVAYTENNRDFAGRRLFFGGRPRTVDFSLQPEEIYTPGFIGTGGWQLREVTAPTDNYLGTQEISAAYVQGDWSFGKWRLIGGARFEENDQSVVSFEQDDPTTPSVDPATIDDSDVLPSFSIVYSLSDRMALRGSASRTVNRPEFREIAAFSFSALIGGFTVFGNPQLEQATLDSFDVRWEWYPSASELFAVSVFYKDFTNPIEQVAIPGSIPSLTFANADGAENRGFELEMRRSFGSFSEALSGWTAIVNYTFVDSEINLNPDTTDATNLDRALVGQPDNIFNLVLEWAPTRWNTTVRALYNFKDDTILFSGRRGLQDVIEDGRSTVDLVWQQGLGRGFSAKLTASNLTDSEREWSQGGLPWRTYKEGRSLGLSLSYTFD